LAVREINGSTVSAWAEAQLLREELHRQRERGEL
jgi:hypothetical protein